MSNFLVFILVFFGGMHLVMFGAKIYFFSSMRNFVWRERERKGGGRGETN